MEFTPKDKKELNAGKLIPAGDYDFEVLAAQEKESSKGNPMIVVKLGVYGPNGGKRFVTDYLMEALAYKLYHFCEAVGIDYHAGALNADDLPGKCGRVRIKIDEAKDGFDEKNSVKDYIPVSGKPTTQPVLQTTHNKPKPITDDAPEDLDDIPW